MPLDKSMSHEDMVAELMASYKKNGFIGATKPRDEKHALEIANAVAYNLEESKKIDKEVKEMKLNELLESLEQYIVSREKDLGISEIEENPKVKVTLDSGETFETEVDPATSEDDLEKQYKTGTEINVGKEGQERKAKIKSATLTKQMGEDYEAEYKEAEDTLSKYFANASDIMKVLDSQVEDQGVQGIKETLAKLQKLIDSETYHLCKTFRNTYAVFDNNSNPYLDFFIDDDEKIKFSEYDLDEALENPPAVIENPTDVISLDIPLLMRLLEWSREQAGEDVDLHVLTENLVEAMKDTEFLTMDDYERLVPCEECSSEEELEECDGSCATTSSDMGADPILPFGKKNKVKQLKNKKSNRTVK